MKRATTDKMIFRQDQTYLNYCTPVIRLPASPMWSTSSIVFTVRKHEPVLVPPAGPTPSELKLLSVIDSQPYLRFHATIIHIFRSSHVMTSIDPASLIRDALAKALVFYYPLAGRLRELPNGKLAVQCTGEGALFVEADADVRLDQLGSDIRPPFPCLDQLVHDTGAADYLTSPILFMQVTRLSCGGFILATQIKHSLVDGTGMAQFLKAVSELARGASSVSVPPVWARERLMARDPPRVTHDHPEYDDLPEKEVEAEGPMVTRSFFFGPREFTALREQLPLNTTCFDMITACLWRSRVAALECDDSEEVKARFVINARNKCSPRLPSGFYGNVVVYPVARATAGELRRQSLAYAVERVRAAKELVTEGYLQSVVDCLALRRRPMCPNVRTISDLSRLGFEEVDFGWGTAVYAGHARVTPGREIFFMKHRNSKGEDGVLVSISFAAPDMERFKVEIEKMVSNVNKRSAL